MSINTGLHPVSINNTTTNNNNTNNNKSRAEFAEKTSTDSAPAGKSKRCDFSLPATGVWEVENLDVSHLISSHADYPLALSSILDMVKL